MIACVYLPSFAADIEWQTKSALKGQVIVLQSVNAKVYGMCSRAAQAGIRTGMNIREAMMLCPAAVVGAANPIKYKENVEALWQLLGVFSNRVEYELPHSLSKSKQSARTYCAVMFYIDIGKVSVKDAYKLGKQIEAEIKKLHHGNIRIGIAANKFTSKIAACYAKPIVLVPSGDEANFLKQKPVAFLPLTPEIARRLNLLGMYLLGDIAKMSLGTALTQFGKPGKPLRQLANGIDVSQIKTSPKYINQTQGCQFESPIDNHEILSAVIGNLSIELSKWLIEIGHQTRCLSLTVRFEDKTVRRVEKQLKRPVDETRLLVQTAATLLNELQVSNAIQDIELSITDFVAIHARQLSLFSTSEEQVDRVQILDDLIRKYGNHCFFHSKLVDRASLVPERRFKVYMAGNYDTSFAA